MNSTDTILQEVRAMAADVLMVDIEEVQPQDSFMVKLDGDSLGFLELGFKCEKRYGIKIQYQKILMQDKLDADESGTLTPESLAILKRELPFLDYARIGDRPLRKRLEELLTIEAIAQIVKREIDAKEAAMLASALANPQTA